MMDKGSNTAQSAKESCQEVRHVDNNNNFRKLASDNDMS